MRKLEEIDVSTLKVSPFVGGLKFSVSKFSGSQYRMSDGVMMPVDYLVDRQESCRVFRDRDISVLLMG